MKKQQTITTKLQNLVKKKNTPLVITKAGSIKRFSRSSDSGGYGGEYSPSYDEE